MLPGIKTHANCIRFCPLLFKLKENLEGTALIDLPYRMLFAVATIDQVLIYTTQSILPLAVINNIHYDTINDLSWHNGSYLAVASSDGFCSFVTMDPNLVGELMPIEEVPEEMREHYAALRQVSFQKNME